MTEIYNIKTLYLQRTTEITKGSEEIGYAYG